MSKSFPDDPSMKDFSARKEGTLKVSDVQTTGPPRQLLLLGASGAHRPGSRG